MSKKKLKAFECSDLALCVLDAMASQGLVKPTTRIPELAPDDEEDYEDESESWRDTLENNQTRAVDKLVALFEQHLDKLPLVKRLSGIIVNLAEDEYEPEMWSLVGIEACTGLEAVEVWTTDPTLDLTPLTSLPRLATVDLTFAGRLKDLKPLLSIPSLKTVIAPALSAPIAKALAARGITVQAKS